MSFFQLFADIHVTLLVEWIPLPKAYSSLDVAMCSRRSRPHWLGLLADPVMKVDLAFEQAPLPGYYHWLAGRELKVSVLHVNVQCMSLITGFDVESIERVVLMGCPSNQSYFLPTAALADFLMRFPNVSQISCQALTCHIRSNDLLEIAKVPHLQLQVLELVTSLAGIEQHLESAAIFAIIYRFGDTLEVLHVNLHSVPSNIPIILDPDVVEYISSRCPNLRALRFPGMKMTKTSLIQLSKSHPFLKELDCKRGGLFTCRDVLEHFSELEVLAVKDIDGIEFIPFAKYPQLHLVTTAALTIDLKKQSLQLGGPYIDASGMEGTILNLILKAPCLLKDLSCDFVVAGTQPKRSDGIIAIAEKHGNHLERLFNFVFVHDIDNETFQHFLVLCPHLRVLVLPETPNLDDEALMSIANHCPKLVNLCIFTDRITDHGVSMILTHCSKLKRLCVRKGKHVTAEVFTHISSLCKFAITGSDHISTVDVVNALEVGKFCNLSALAFGSCRLLKLHFVTAVASVMGLQQQLQIEGIHI